MANRRGDEIEFFRGPLIGSPLRRVLQDRAKLSLQRPVMHPGEGPQALQNLLIHTPDVYRFHTDSIMLPSAGVNIACADAIGFVLPISGVDRSEARCNRRTFRDYLCDGGPPPMPLDIEVKNLEILHKVYKAARW